MRHGELKFGYQISPEEWRETQEQWSKIDFDPYEPDWRDK